MPNRYHQRFTNWLTYRYALYQLGHVDDRLLADMGLTRDTMVEKLKRAHQQGGRQ